MSKTVVRILVALVFAVGAHAQAGSLVTPPMGVFPGKLCCFAHNQGPDSVNLVIRVIDDSGLVVHKQQMTVESLRAVNACDPDGGNEVFPVGYCHFQIVSGSPSLIKGSACVQSDGHCGSHLGATEVPSNPFPNPRAGERQ